MECKSLFAFELKGDVGDTGEFEGYGSTFGNVDLGDDVVARGAFAQTIADHVKSGTMPAMFFSHDMNEPIGDWLHMEEDARGLRMAGKLWLGKGITKAEQAYMMLKSKSPKGLSIGYITRDSSIDKKGVRTLLDVDLKEVSPTSFPMNPKAVATSVKATKLPDVYTKRDLESYLRDAGMSISQAKALLASGWKGIDPRDAEDDVLKSYQTTLRILKGS